MPNEVTRAGSLKWQNTLVGFFIGKKLPFSLLKNATTRLRTKHGLVDMIATDSGFFFFTFHSKEENLVVLERGPWHIAGQPIILRPWKAGLTLSKATVSTIPVWVHIYNIPLEFWSPAGLSHIASSIGKPIHVDRAMASCRRISYARICIEINAKHDLLNELSVEFEDPITREVETIKLPVEY